MASVAYQHALRTGGYIPAIRISSKALCSSLSSSLFLSWSAAVITQKRILVMGTLSERWTFHQHEHHPFRSNARLKRSCGPAVDDNCKLLNFLQNVTAYCRRMLAGRKITHKFTMYKNWRTPQLFVWTACSGPGSCLASYYSHNRAPKHASFQALHGLTCKRRFQRATALQK